MVLDQYAEQARDRADDRAVEHDRGVPRVVIAYVFGAEASRHAEVDLHGAALPDAADAVLQRVLDLRAVERAPARRDGKLQATFLERRFQGRLGLVPSLVGADASLRTSRH